MKNKKNKYNVETQLVQAENHPQNQYGFVSPPIYRGSTAIYPDIQKMKNAMFDPFKKVLPNYGRFGNPNSQALENAICSLENGFGAVCTGSGLSAITTAILAFVQSGDHILIVDSVYWPTRNFCNSLKRFGVEAEYYDPCIGSNIESLFKPNTKLVFMESPGSMTFEIQDVPAIAKACQNRNIKTLIDNTWATPLFLKPLTYGVDVSIHSATKYICGHSDSFLGIIICNEKSYQKVRTQAIDLGQCAGAEDVFIALRGLRTLSVRVQQHQTQAHQLATWLKERPEVSEVLYPALPTDRFHQLWKRDFTGATGLLGIVLKSNYSMSAAEKMVEKLKIFGLGHSWGGYESLVMIGEPSTYRLPESWKHQGPLIRFHVGFENIEDLKIDLENGFKTLEQNG